MNLSKRSTEKELMDDPNLDPITLGSVLTDIALANKTLGGNKITIQAIWQLIQDNPKSKYSIVDMGCGNGSMLREIVNFGRGKNIEFEAIGIDLNKKSIEIARSESLGYPEIKYLEQDILELKPIEFSCDILLCTLTMHHFKDSEIVVFLDKFVKLALLGVVINDLHRSKLSYFLFGMFSTFFTHTKVAKNDGLVSIKSGFKKSELIRFSTKLNNAKHEIRWKWAFRYVWVIKPNRLTEVYE